MVWVAELVLLLGQSICGAQRELAALHREVVIDEVAVHRVIRLFSGCYIRLVSFPVSGFPVKAGQVSVREQAVEAVRILTTVGGRDPLVNLVLAFHQTWFPNLLLDLQVA